MMNSNTTTVVILVVFMGGLCFYAHSCFKLLSINECSKACEAGHKSIKSNVDGCVCE